GLHRRAARGALSPDGGDLREHRFSGRRAGGGQGAAGEGEGGARPDAGGGGGAGEGASGPPPPARGGHAEGERLGGGGPRDLAGTRPPAAGDPRALQPGAI